MDPQIELGKYLANEYLVGLYALDVIVEEEGKLELLLFEDLVDEFVFEVWRHLFEKGCSESNFCTVAYLQIYAVRGDV